MRQFEEQLRKLFGKLQEEKRWSSHNPSYSESVLEHSMKMAWVVQFMIAIELEANNPHQLDCYSLLQCAVNHDIAESVIGDIPYDEKNDDDEQNEAKAFKALIIDMIPQNLRHYFPLPIDMSLTADEKHKRFWNTAERIGYCIFTLAEDAIEFDEIVTRHVRELEKSYEFISVAKFCDMIKSDYQERLITRQ